MVVSSVTRDRERGREGERGRKVSVSAREREREKEREGEREREREQKKEREEKKTKVDNFLLCTHRVEVWQDLLERNRRRHPEVGEGAGEGRQRREARGAVEDEGELGRG